MSKLWYEFKSVWVGRRWKSSRIFIENSSCYSSRCLCWKIHRAKGIIVSLKKSILFSVIFFGSHHRIFFTVIFTKDFDKNYGFWINYLGLKNIFCLWISSVFIHFDNDLISWKCLKMRETPRKLKSRVVHYHCHWSRNHPRGIFTFLPRHELPVILLSKWPAISRLSSSKIHISPDWYRGGLLIIAVIFRMGTKYDCNDDDNGDQIWMQSL